MSGSVDDVLAGQFRLAGPHPRTEQVECPGHFASDPDAQGWYADLRSTPDPFKLRIYDLVHVSGSVVGFIAYQLGVQDFIDQRNLYVLVQYIYVQGNFRSRKLWARLLVPLFEDVHLALRNSTGERDARPLRIHSTSEALIKGRHVLRALEDGLVAITRTHDGAELFGVTREHPPGARQRAWDSLSREKPHDVT